MHSETVTPEFRQHHAVSSGHNPRGQRVQRVETQTTLDRMLYRERITIHQHHAGEKLFRDFTHAGIASRTSIALDEIRGQGDPEAQQHARQRYYDAILTLPMTMQRIARDVCCIGDTVEVASRNSGLHHERGAMVLKDALDVLALHYGLVSRKIID
jgi:hypothetical protein